MGDSIMIFTSEKKKVDYLSVFFWDEFGENDTTRFNVLLQIAFENEITNLNNGNG